MGETSAIEWTEATWNPWYGCQKISPGCKFCYMYREMERYGRDPFTVTRSKTKFNDPLKWIKKPETTPKFCFTCSWSDFFIEQADAWRAEAWDIIKRTPQITYQILTKRPELVKDRLPADWDFGYRNVWLGVSVEGPEQRRRIYELQQIESRTRFISFEPLIADPYATHTLNLLRIHWVIVGGESGPQARPMNPEWARGIRDDCRDQGVAFFMKQMGGTASAKGGDLADIPEDLRIREYPEVRA